MCILYPNYSINELNLAKKKVFFITYLCGKKSFYKIQLHVYIIILPKVIGVSMGMGLIRELSVVNKIFLLLKWLTRNVGS